MKKILRGLLVWILSVSIAFACFRYRAHLRVDNYADLTDRLTQEEKKEIQDFVKLYDKLYRKYFRQGIFLHSHRRSGTSMDIAKMRKMDYYEELFRGKTQERKNELISREKQLDSSEQVWIALFVGTAVYFFLFASSIPSKARTPRTV